MVNMEVKKWNLTAATKIEDLLFVLHPVKLKV